MNFLSLLVRNLKNGPSTEIFPFGPAKTPARFRGRIAFDAPSCEGCKLCERVCPANAIKFTKAADGLAFDCWHDTCVFCGNCEFYCPTKSIRQTTDWHLAHTQAEKYTMVEHGLIPNMKCVECGATALDTAPNVAKVKPAMAAEEVAELRARCPKCRAKFLKARRAKP